MKLAKQLPWLTAILLSFSIAGTAAADSKNTEDFPPGGDLKELIEKIIKVKAAMGIADYHRERVVTITANLAPGAPGDAAQGDDLNISINGEPFIATSDFESMIRRINRKLRGEKTLRISSVRVFDPTSPINTGPFSVLIEACDDSGDRLRSFIGNIPADLITPGIPAQLPSAGQLLFTDGIGVSLQPNEFLCIRQNGANINPIFVEVNGTLVW